MRHDPNDYPRDEDGDAIRNGWNPDRETLEAWRDRRREHWRSIRDEVLRTGDY